MKASSRLINRLMFLVVASTYGATATRAGDDARTPVPDAVSVEAAEKLVREVFAEEHAAAKSTADKVALAKKILAAAKRLREIAEIAAPMTFGRTDEIRPGGQLPCGQCIDLLDWVDTSRDIVTGNWSKDGEELKATAPVRGARLMLPVNLNGSYELAVEFTRTAGDRDVALVLPVGSHQCLAVLSGWNNEARIHGIGWIDGRSEKNNPTTVRSGRLTNGQRYVLLVRVKIEGDMAAVAMFLNGGPLTAWSGKQTSLSVPHDYAIPESSRPGLVAWLAEVIVHSARLRPVDGEATRTTRLSVRKSTTFLTKPLPESYSERAVGIEKPISKSPL